MDCKYGFKEARRGYDPSEVDAYIDEQLARMTAMQKQNAVLMRKLQEAEEKIRKYTSTEDALKRSIAESKRGAAAMIGDARARSTALVNTAREECNKIVDALDAEIEDRYKTIEDMKATVASFKNELFKLYSEHIEDIEALSEASENFVYEPDFTALSDAIDVFEEGAEPAPAETPQFPEIPEESFFESEEIVSEEEEIEDPEDVVEEPELSQMEFGFDEPSEEEIAEEAPEAAAEEDDAQLFFDLEDLEEISPEEIEAQLDEEDMVFEFTEEELAVADLDAIIEEKLAAQDEIAAEEAPAENDELFTFIEDADVEEDSDDDMFITEDSTTKEDEELFNFLKDFVNGTEE